MSKQRRKQRNKGAKPLNTAQKIVHYAGRVDREGFVGAAGMKLMDQVQACLHKKDDASLDRALTLASADIYPKLKLFVELEATTNDALSDADTEEQLCTELFAIPVIIGLNADEAAEVPCVVPEVGWITESMRSAGLSMKDTGDAGFAIMPELWSHSDLSDLTYSTISRITKSFEDNLSSERVPGPAEIMMPIMPEQEPAPPDGMGFYLKFLLGVCTYSFSKELPFERKENRSKVEQWTDSMEELFSRHMPGNYEVLAPENLYRALESGGTFYRLTALGMTMASEFLVTGTEPEDTVICISAHGANDAADELRIAGYHADSRDAIFTFIWDLWEHEDPNAILAMATDLFERHGIGDIQVSEELHSDLRCECCGEPTFLTPGGEPGKHPGALLPAPASIQ